SLVTACNEIGVKVQVVPGIDDLVSGAVTLRPRDVNIQDLLHRDPVHLDGEAVGRFLRGRAILITGAAGSIGSELCRQVLTLPTKVPSDSLGRIGSLKRTSGKSLFPTALGSCCHRITHQLRPINMNGRSILSVMSGIGFPTRTAHS